MTQMIDLPTRKERTLNLFVTTNPTLVNSVITLLPHTIVMDNGIIFVAVHTRAAKWIQITSATIVYKYKMTDWQVIPASRERRHEELQPHRRKYTTAMGQS